MLEINLLASLDWYLYPTENHHELKNKSTRFLNINLKKWYIIYIFVFLVLPLATRETKTTYVCFWAV